MPIDLYPNIAKIKRNGAYQNLPGFVQQSGDADIKAMIANSEISTTAQYAHPKGSYFILNDILYKAILDIAVNGTIAVGTNCEVAILGNDVSNIENDINDFKSAVGTETANLLTLKKSETVNGVTFKNNGANGFSLIGTATSSGGRGRKLTELLTLPAGTYYACIFYNDKIPEFFIQNSSNTILKYISNPNYFYTFTLSNETSIFIGTNVVNETTYNINNAYLFLSSQKPSAMPHYSAVDFLSRIKLEDINSLKESSLYTLKERFPFTVGSYNSSTDVVSDSTRYRLVSREKYTCQEPIRVYMPSGYKYGIELYDGNSRTDTGWLHGEYIIPANKTFLLQLTKDPEVTSDKIYDPKTSDLYSALTFESYNNKPNGIISVKRISLTRYYSQGACKVGNYLVGFDASPDDHSANTGKVLRYELNNNYNELTAIYHNLGHCATADYMESNDTAIIGSGTYTHGSPESIFLVKNMKTKMENITNLIIPDPDIIEIDLRNLEGVSCGVCFGESEQIAYVVKVESATQYDAYPTKYIYKVMLGQGSNDLSGETGGYGTFISGADSFEYNGTLKVIKSYTFPAGGEVQGMKYRNGSVYLSADTSKFDSQKTPYFIKLNLQESTVEYFKIPFYSSVDGLEKSAEAEGFIFDGAFGYVVAIGSGLYRLFKFDSNF